MKEIDGHHINHPDTHHHYCNLDDDVDDDNIHHYYHQCYLRQHL